MRALQSRPGGGFWRTESFTDASASAVIVALDETGRRTGEELSLPEGGWNVELAQRAGQVLALYYAPAPAGAGLHSALFGCGGR